MCQEAILPTHGRKAWAFIHLRENCSLAQKRKGKSGLFEFGAVRHEDLEDLFASSVYFPPAAASLMNKSEIADFITWTQSNRLKT